MRTYTARLIRINPGAGPQSSLTIVVNAPSSEMARTTAEAQFPGYRCINSPTRQRS